LHGTKAVTGGRGTEKKGRKEKEREELDPPFDYFDNIFSTRSEEAK